ncbi:MAG: porin [Rhodobacteraceae bacterium]|nr:porin [Paracoccaceae bacterium]
MKKIFLTSAALALACGGGVAAMEHGGAAFASAAAKFGVEYNEANDGREAQFLHDVDIVIGASGTTDNGLTFGAKVKIEDTDDVVDGQVHVSINGMHTFTVGDGLDAADILAGGLGEPGLDATGIGADDWAEKLRNATNRDFRYDGKFGMASVALTLGDADIARLENCSGANRHDDEGNLSIDPKSCDIINSDEAWAVGFSFDLAPARIGVGVDSEETISFGADYGMGPIGAALYVAMNGDTSNDPGDQERMGAGVQIDYAMDDDTSIRITAGQDDDDNVKRNGYGAGFTHDLGGNATLAGAFGSVDDGAGDAMLRADFGIQMTF